MALTNQPYLPLYVNDWLSSTKLKSCSAQAHGLMINLMCLMHKEDGYGRILLKQKFKQSDKQILNFASQFAKVLPFDLLEISAGLEELVDEGVLSIDGEFLISNRMIKDADLSQKRAINGKKGGVNTMANTKKNSQDFAQAKVQANTENEYEYIIEYIIEYLNKKVSKNFQSSTGTTRKLIIARLKEGYTKEQFQTVIDTKTAKWLTDESMAAYLRPATLFGNKFESYLNETFTLVKHTGTKPALVH